MATTMVGIGVDGRHNGGRKPDRTDDGAAGQGHVVLHTDSFELMLEGVIRVRCLRKKQPQQTIADSTFDPLPIRFPPPIPLSFNIGFQRSGIRLRKKQPLLRKASGSFSVPQC